MSSGAVCFSRLRRWYNRRLFMILSAAGQRNKSTSIQEYLYIALPQGKTNKTLMPILRRSQCFPFPFPAEQRNGQSKSCEESRFGWFCDHARHCVWRTWGRKTTRSHRDVLCHRIENNTEIWHSGTADLTKIFARVQPEETRNFLMDIVSYSRAAHEYWETKIRVQTQVSYSGAQGSDADRTLIPLRWIDKNTSTALQTVLCAVKRLVQKQGLPKSMELHMKHATVC